MRPKQQTLAASGFERYRKRKRRERFLADMDPVIPWAALMELIVPLYPKGEGAGRPPMGLARMLRIYFLQHWFNLSDPAVEERSTIRGPCASSSALTWAPTPCRTKRPSCGSATCWRA